MCITCWKRLDFLRRLLKVVAGHDHAMGSFGINSQQTPSPSGSRLRRISSASALLKTNPYGDVRPLFGRLHDFRFGFQKREDDSRFRLLFGNGVPPRDPQRHATMPIRLNDNDGPLLVLALISRLSFEPALTSYSCSSNNPHHSSHASYRPLPHPRAAASLKALAPADFLPSIVPRPPDRMADPLTSDQRARLQGLGPPTAFVNAKRNGLKQHPLVMVRLSNNTSPPEFSPPSAKSERFSQPLHCRPTEIVL